MQHPADLKLEKIVVKQPNPSFDDDLEAGKEMRFAFINHCGKALSLTFSATVTNPPELTEYDEDLRMEVRLPMKEMRGLMDLESILEHDSGHKQPWDMPASYSLKSAFADNRLRLKLKKKEDGCWSFYTDAKDFQPADLKEGTEINVLVNPGFYFNEPNDSYGLYLRVREILFTETEDTEPAKTANEKGKAPSKMEGLKKKKAAKDAKKE